MTDVKKRACMHSKRIQVLHFVWPLSMHSKSIICSVCAVSMPAPDEQETVCTLQARDASKFEPVRVTAVCT